MLAHDDPTLDELIRRKAEFLADHGCDADLEGILDALGLVDDDRSSEDLLESWFDAVAARLGGCDCILLHRHMTVRGFDAYVLGLEAGSETLGTHWSLDEATLSVSPEQSDVDVLLTGRVDVDQVNWFSTFQAHLLHPHEAEVVFSGDVRLEEVRETGTGRTWRAGGRSFRTFEDPGSGPTP